jgi:hypothetical protein
MTIRDEDDSDMIFDPTIPELVEAARRLEIEKRNDLLRRDGYEQTESDIDGFERGRDKEVR